MEETSHPFFSRVDESHDPERESAVRKSSGIIREIPRADFLFSRKNFSSRHSRLILLKFCLSDFDTYFFKSVLVDDLEIMHISHHYKSHIVDSRGLFHEKKRTGSPHVKCG